MTANPPSDLELYCLIQDDPAGFFSVMISPDANLDKLQKIIQSCNQHGFLRTVDAKDLVLWRLNTLEPLSTLVIDQLSERATRLSRREMRLSRVFPQQPDEGLHIIVQRPGTHDEHINNAKQRTVKDYIAKTPPRGTPSEIRPKLQETSPKPKEEIELIISRFQSENNHVIAEFINRPDVLPLWEPPFNMAADDKHWLKALKIPLSGEKDPDLLLHDLGINQSEQLKSWIKGVFNAGGHTLLVNTEGSGKTRLLLEGLCGDRWGFYLTSAVGHDDIGSMDIQCALSSSLEQATDYHKAHGVLQSGSVNSPDRKAALDHIIQITNRCFANIMVSRFLIFAQFIKLSHDHAFSVTKQRRLWVLLQVKPPLAFRSGHDIFTALALSLRGLSYFDADNILYDVHQQIMTDLNYTSPLFWILDEAQAAAKMYNDDFVPSAEPGRKRSVLRGMITCWAKFMITRRNLKIIVSGTGLSVDDVAQTISGVGKTAMFQIRHDVGAFTRSSQEEYVRQYIPPHLFEHEAWKIFLGRVWAWFRGRHRFTASLLSNILQNGLRSPHSVINLTIMEWTGYHATEASLFTVHEEAPSVDAISKQEMFKISELDSTPGLSVLLSRAVFSYVWRGVGILADDASDSKTAHAIQYGFARYSHSTTNPFPHTRSALKILFDEPIPILAVIQHFEKFPALAELAYLDGHVGYHSSEDNGFETYLAHHLRHVFNGNYKLCDILTDRSGGDGPDWLSERAQLVVLSRSSSSVTQIDAVLPKGGPSEVLAITCEEKNDVLEWLRTNKQHVPFCFPPREMGPDILFFLQLENKTIVLVSLQAKYLQARVSRPNLMMAIQTVTPSHFWRYRIRLQDALPGLQQGCAGFDIETDHLLTTIPQPALSSDANYPVLRVIAGWPTDPELYRSLQHPRTSSVKDMDRHPLCTLNQTAFEKIYKELRSACYERTVKPMFNT
ncbi:hypothetical protein HETIRDRAFT_386139 [Heterobasidion irregulare TC 32-1]|uniref:Crinkler effector protein N-terminal domain-containing protein n=1 Tax=Heterobasidion irregulare (strain TC 32-1) TaxID=747525 RepID=W4K1G5_HETIT|nr:uncharacterized protein HETIRDRAFT_386139 [Heterobasidion irregulare TC 32-1]ETW79652.1 hypothetical protein HETIRDRAFT_386139 [Heterobasidion irregulare TC 32-1]